jgi:hypothetical protein
MMLIATGLAVALSTSPIEAAPASLPPVVVSVIETPGVPTTLVSRLLDETGKIWRAAGVTFLWRRTAQIAVPDPRIPDTGPLLPTALRVVIGNETGVARDHRTPLGWIVFEADGAPQQQVYLSYRNALTLLIASRVVAGSIEQMPLLRREVLIARAMGRALAHELGHYLLASKVHTRRGLLQASRTAGELFAEERSGFRVDLWQQHIIASRLTGAPVVATRW